MYQNPHILLNKIKKYSIKDIRKARSPATRPESFDIHLSEDRNPMEPTFNEFVEVALEASSGRSTEAWLAKEIRRRSRLAELRQWWRDLEFTSRQVFDLLIGTILVLLILFGFGAKAQQDWDEAENKKAFEEIFSRKPLG